MENIFSSKVYNPVCIPFSTDPTVDWTILKITLSHWLYFLLFVFEATYVCNVYTAECWCSVAHSKMACESKQDPAIRIKREDDN